MPDRKCSKCQKRAATIKLVRVVEGKARSLHLCEACAAASSPYVPKQSISLQDALDQEQSISLQEAIDQVLSKLLKKQIVGLDGNADAGTPVPDCPSCGRSFGDYSQSFLLGCPGCYDAFGERIEPQLRRLHGNTRHVDRRPHADETAMVAGGEQTLRDLEQGLQAAVSGEDFEKAARLRDRIRYLRSELGHVVQEMPEM